MNRFRAFKIDYLGATNTKPARIKITDLRYNKTVIVNYTAKGQPTGEARAIEYLNEQDIKITAKSWAENSLSQHLYDILLTENFTNQLK